jgi:signal transduction histidine kinase
LGNIRISTGLEGAVPIAAGGEHGLSALVSALPYPTLLFEAATERVACVNPAARALLGAESGMAVRALLPGAEGAAWPALNSGSVRWTARRIDGEPVAVELALAPMPGGWTIASLRDLTDHHTAVQALRRSEARTAAIVDGLPDLLLLMNRDGILLDFHVPRGIHLPLPPGEFLGRPLDPMLLGPVAEVAPGMIARALATGEVQLFEYQLPMAPGQRYEARAVASGDDEALVFIRDITGLHQIEEALRAQNDKLRELDRLKSDFISTVSHELRTPLTSIVGYAEFLEDDPLGVLSDDQVEYVAQIQTSAKRLRRLVDDLLEFGLLDFGSFRLACAEESLMQKLRLVVHSLRPQLDRKRIRLELDVPDDALMVVMDGDRIEQVVTNLVHNAIKFTPEGGHITVSAVALVANVRVAVRDSGIGIPADKRSRLFEKFFQVDPSLRRIHGGAGLGLAICKALVEAHGGAIGVDSAPGEGSTFWFTLPWMCQHFNETDGAPIDR